MTTVLAKTPPKRVPSRGPAVAMNRAAQLRIEKVQTQQINNTIRIKIEMFEKQESQQPPQPEAPALIILNLDSVPQKQESLPKTQVNGNKEIVIIVKIVTSKWQEKIENRAPKFENLELVLFSNSLMVTIKKSNKLHIMVDYCHEDLVQLKGVSTQLLYSQVKNSKPLKPVLLTMLNNSQDKKLDLVVTFEGEAQCLEWLRIIAKPNLVQKMKPEASDPDQKVMTLMVTALAKPPPRRVPSPGPAVAMNRAAQLRLQKAHGNGSDQRRPPFKV